MKEYGDDFSHVRAAIEDGSFSEDDYYFVDYLDNKIVAQARCPMMTKEQMSRFVHLVTTERDFSNLRVFREADLSRIKEYETLNDSIWATVREAIFDERYQAIHNRILSGNWGGWEQGVWMSNLHQPER